MDPFGFLLSDGFSFPLSSFVFYRWLQSTESEREREIVTKHHIVCEWSLCAISHFCIPFVTEKIFAVFLLFATFFFSPCFCAHFFNVLC